MKVVYPELMGPLAADLEMRTKTICEQLFDGTLEHDVWKRAMLPSTLGGLGIRSGHAN